MNNVVNLGSNAVPMNPVSSSQIDSVGYDATRGMLVVKFKSGGEYEYSNVTQQQYNSLLASESVGQSFAAIKKNPQQYPFKKRSI